MTDLNEQKLDFKNYIEKQNFHKWKYFISVQNVSPQQKWAV